MKFLEFFLLFLTVNTFLDVQGVVWPCQSDTDCSSVPTAKCSQYGNCRCPAGYVFSTNFTKCLKASLYGDKCEESVQCSHMPSGASCKKGVCECDEGSTYIRGRCQILNGLNEPCKEDVDCRFGYDRESVKCTNNKCTCADNYYHRYGNICRRKSVGIGDSCNVNQDCEYFDKNSSSAKCSNSVCVEASETRKTSREIAVQTSFDTFGHLKEKKGILKKSESVQDETVELKVLSEDTENSSKAFGDECANNGKPCEGLDHSQCVEHICYCKLGYYNLGGKCMAELGERSRDISECGIDPNRDFNTVTKNCICKHAYFYEPNLRTCRKPLRSFTASCVAQSQCSPFGLAYCDMDGKPKRCKCEIYAEYDDNRQLCIYKGVGSYCEKAEDCKILNTLCSNDKVCACKPKYVETKGQCLPGIGGHCTSNEECVVENSVCPFQDIPESKFCQCKKGYVLFDEKCIKEATEVGEDCVDNEQCKPLLGNLGKCIENKCGCDSKHHLSYGKCQEKIELGGKCTKTSECYNPEEPKAMECKNSVCRCQPGYSADVEKRICIKPKTNSSGRPSVLKIITFLLIGAAFLITSAAIKQAYY